ncbi:hypothetical protein CVS40_2460 [Lucilia cuprina]|nr:hypothetical protein CVS40_2460 [Lucilia cuprina]
MESSPFVMKSSNTKRFVIEDSITKVTSDGEPHEMMTMIAGLSGLLAAMVILTVLIFLVACKKSKSKHECDKCSETGSTTGPAGEIQSKCSSTVDIYNPKQLQGRSISVICAREENLGCRNSIKGNLHSNLNKAFESSELELQRPKQKKKTHWQDEMEMQRETSIQIERY